MKESCLLAHEREVPWKQMAPPTRSQEVGETANMKRVIKNEMCVVFNTAGTLRKIKQ